MTAHIAIRAKTQQTGKNQNANRRFATRPERAQKI
jgi:hypothetical protein